MKLALLLILSFILVSFGYSANILFIFPIPCPSHHIFTSVLVKALIKKGHHITMVSPYRMEEKIQNYTEVIVDGMVEYKESKYSILINFFNDALSVCSL